MSQDKRSSHATTSEANLDRLEAFFTKLETPFVPTKEDLALLAHSKTKNVISVGFQEVLNLVTLAELLGATMSDISQNDWRKKEIEMRLQKRNRAVLIKLTPGKVFLVTYLEDDVPVGDTQAQIGFRRIANWLG